jgi:hypothetical protein
MLRRDLLGRLPDNGVNSLGKVLDIVSVQTRHADASVLRHVDVVLLAQRKDLVLGETSEREHADLIGNVVPCAGSLELLELRLQRLAHLDNATGHGAEIAFPLSEELLVVENCGGDTCAVCGRVGDLGTLEDGELRGHALGGVLGVGAGRGDEVEAACTLAVETEVLGVGLCDEELEALLDEVTDGPVVCAERSGGEALVGAVEEGELLPLLHYRGNLLPLILGRIHTCGVVCAGV